ncbi:MAG TPA: hypothetical protein VJ997_11620 [Longimicrobiales bacterium]|nr:hypothetical protein [Longimicrobiales bacterium]
MNPGRTGPKNLWGDRPAPAPGETQRLGIGPLTLWIKGAEGEVWLAHARTAAGEAPPSEPPEEGDWSRWAFHDVAHHLRILPTLPDRPLVVKPEHPFTLLRRAAARVYMRVPAWVRVEVVEDQGGRVSVLGETPTMHLSDTWWGDFQEGELAFWLPTMGRRELTPDLFDTHMVMSVIQLDNLSNDDLRVEKLALRVEHLSIYEKDGWLWAEETRVNYHGEDEGSEIHMDDEPPREAEGAREITPARAQKRSFRTRTFARLKALSGWGG